VKIGHSFDLVHYLVSGIWTPWLMRSSARCLPACRIARAGNVAIFVLDLEITQFVLLGFPAGISWAIYGYSFVYWLFDPQQGIISPARRLCGFSFDPGALLGKCNGSKQSEHAEQKQNLFHVE